MSDALKEKLAFIFGRRSIRAYLDKPISEEVVQVLLEAAMAAPSARAQDPWRFVVVRDKATLRRIAEGLPFGRMLPSAGVGLVVCGDLEAAHDHQLSYLLQDCSAAVENVLLSAHVLGLGACWLGVHPREDRMSHIRTVLRLPPSIIPVCGIAIGYPDEQKESRTRYNQAYVHHEKW
jgi:nitroreductase